MAEDYVVLARPWQPRLVTLVYPDGTREPADAKFVKEPTGIDDQRPAWVVTDDWWRDDPDFAEYLPTAAVASSGRSVPLTLRPSLSKADYTTRIHALVVRYEAPNFVGPGPSWHGGELVSFKGIEVFKAGSVRFPDAERRRLEVAARRGGGKRDDADGCGLRGGRDLHAMVEPPGSPGRVRDCVHG